MRVFLRACARGRRRNRDQAKVPGIGTFMQYIIINILMSHRKQPEIESFRQK